MARGRKPSVRYWKSRKGGGYFATIGGKQEELALGVDDFPDGPTYIAALARFSSLMSMSSNKGSDDYLVSAMLNQYRTHMRFTHQTTDKAKLFDSLCQRFVELHGGRRVGDLRPYHVDDYLNSNAQWNPTSKATVGRMLLSCVAWAKRKGYIRTDPLAKGVQLPRALVRGREAMMSGELMDLLIAEVKTGKTKGVAYSAFLWALRETGARPVEIRMADAEHYKDGRIVFRWNAKSGYVHKTAAKTQRDRVIYLAGELRQWVEAEIARNGPGPIFRSPRGRRWGIRGSQNKWGWLLALPVVTDYLRSHGIERRELKLYNFRHTFISDWMDRQGDIYIVAKICGTSVKMIETRYGHVNPEKVHERYEQFMRTR